MEYRLFCSQEFGSMKHEQRREYIARINRVLDYIEDHLDDELSLTTLAGIANFSPYHFHRIFSGMVGESLNRHIQRVRIEKAANQLVTNPRKTITEVALDCGFTGSDTFARAFRDSFGMSASQWREGGYRAESKNRKSDRKDGQTLRKDRQAFNIIQGGNFAPAIITDERRKQMIDPEQVQVTVKDLPERHVAYIRHIGPYKGDSQLFEGLFTKLFNWAGPRGLIRMPETQVLAIYHDNPDITDESKLRTSVGITVPEDTEVEGEVGKMVLSSGKHAIAHFELASDEYEEAWKAVYGHWLPDSGYQPDDQPCFESYLNDPKQHPEGKCIVEICVPVKPL